ncbi:MAG: hypothetical protein Kow0019_13670 [Methanobacteriaceae archaeon]
MNSENIMVPLEEVESKVNKALNKLFKNDHYLLFADANERSISHKFAEYLQQEFEEWNVDCEYNRDHHDIKRISDWKNRCLKEKEYEDADAKTVYPDIIIHHRNTRNNLLVIEIKKSTNTDNGKCDIKKIRNFIKELNYKYGIFINFKVGEELGIKSLKWFHHRNLREVNHE